MGLTVINNTNTLRIVHSKYDLIPRQTLSVAYKKVDKPVIQLRAN